MFGLHKYHSVFPDRPPALPLPVIRCLFHHSFTFCHYFVFSVYLLFLLSLDSKGISVPHRLFFINTKTKHMISWNIKTSKSKVPTAVSADFHKLYEMKIYEPVMCAIVSF